MSYTDFPVRPDYVLTRRGRTTKCEILEIDLEPDTQVGDDFWDENEAMQQFISDSDTDPDNEIEDLTANDQIEANEYEGVYGDDVFGEAVHEEIVYQEAVHEEEVVYKEAVHNEGEHEDAFDGGNENA